ncbi:MAG: hypothetical protein IBJ13_08015 [Sphingopyxis sp.]|nr:hypothetical protein [Sphingopyxis sp.]
MRRSSRGRGDACGRRRRSGRRGNLYRRRRSHPAQLFGLLRNKRFQILNAPILLRKATLERIQTRILCMGGGS